MCYQCTGGVYLQQERQLGAFNGYTKGLEDMPVLNLQLETSIRVADLVGDLADEAVMMTYIIPVTFIPFSMYHVNGLNESLNTIALLSGYQQDYKMTGT